MDNTLARRRNARMKRVMRVRKKLHGSQERPRLSVLKSNAHLYAQLIDDDKGVTIAGVGTLSKHNQKTPYNRKSKEAARELGKQIAALAKKHNINTVIFDRGRYKFHGVVAELATAARTAGLQF
jgi:large subunit ribosomal protein L18